MGGASSWRGRRGHRTPPHVHVCPLVNMFISGRCPHPFGEEGKREEQGRHWKDQNSLDFSRWQHQRESAEGNQLRPVWDPVRAPTTWCSHPVSRVENKGDWGPSPALTSPGNCCVQTPCPCRGSAAVVSCSPQFILWVAWRPSCSTVATRHPNSWLAQGGLIRTAGVSLGCQLGFPMRGPSSSPGLGSLKKQGGPQGDTGAGTDTGGAREAWPWGCTAPALGQRK